MSKRFSIVPLFEETKKLRALCEACGCQLAQQPDMSGDTDEPICNQCAHPDWNLACVKSDDDGEKPFPSANPSVSDLVSIMRDMEDFTSDENPVEIVIDADEEETLALLRSLISETFVRKQILNEIPEPAPGEAPMTVPVDVRGVPDVPPLPPRPEPTPDWIEEQVRRYLINQLPQDVSSESRIIESNVDMSVERRYQKALVTKKDLIVEGFMATLGKFGHMIFRHYGGTNIVDPARIVYANKEIENLTFQELSQYILDNPGRNSIGHRYFRERQVEVIKHYQDTLNDPDHPMSKFWSAWFAENVARHLPVAVGGPMAWKIARVIGLRGAALGIAFGTGYIIGTVINDLIVAPAITDYRVGVRADLLEDVIKHRGDATVPDGWSWGEYPSRSTVSNPIGPEPMAASIREVANQIAHPDSSIMNLAQSRRSGKLKSFESQLKAYLMSRTTNIIYEDMGRGFGVKLEGDRCMLTLDVYLALVPGAESIWAWNERLKGQDIGGQNYGCSGPGYKNYVPHNVVERKIWELRDLEMNAINVIKPYGRGGNEGIFRKIMSFYEDLLLRFIRQKGWFVYGDVSDRRAEAEGRATGAEDPFGNTEDSIVGSSTEEERRVDALADPDADAENLRPGVTGHRAPGTRDQVHIDDLMHPRVGFQQDSNRPRRWRYPRSKPLAYYSGTSNFYLSYEVPEFDDAAYLNLPDLAREIFPAGSSWSLNNKIMYMLRLGSVQSSGRADKFNEQDHTKWLNGQENLVPGTTIWIPGQIKVDRSQGIIHDAIRGPFRILTTSGGRYCPECELNVGRRRQAYEHSRFWWEDIVPMRN